MQIVKDYQYKERYFELKHSTNHTQLLNYNMAKYAILTVNNGKKSFLSNLFCPKDD